VLQRDYQQRHCSDALLTIDHQPAGDGRIDIGFRDVDGGADEMAVQLRVPADADDVVPKLLAMALLPAVGALKNRNNKLLRAFEQLGELEVLGFHGFLMD
jgi:hypothetical protein